MIGQARTELLFEYITAVERGAYRLPTNTPAFDAPKGTTVEDVYAPARWNSHLSDFVAAFAIMHNAAGSCRCRRVRATIRLRVEVAARAHRRPGPASAARGWECASGRDATGHRRPTRVCRCRAPGRHALPLNVIPQRSPGDTIKNMAHLLVHAERAGNAASTSQPPSARQATQSCFGWLWLLLCDRAAVLVVVV
jgi:hypothetical protein